MAKRERILVVVDPGAAAQPALQRAVQLAQPMGWSIELLACVHEGMPRQPGGSPDPKAVRSAVLARQLGYLRDLARTHSGLQIGTKAVWDRPLHEAIIRETLRSEARIVMKETQYQSKIARALVTNADWHLIRDCPAPLWLVRGPDWPARPVIAAFLDPLHQHDKPAALDRRILNEAALVASRLDGELHAVHCYDEGTAATVTATALAGTATTGRDSDDEALLRSRLAELAAAEGLGAERIHLRAGPAPEGIPAAARELDADLVVMGAVSRSRLEQAFIGNTAERVLDRLESDVLVVKPPRFDSPVAYRAQPADFMELS